MGFKRYPNIDVDMLNLCSFNLIEFSFFRNEEIHTKR